MKDCGNAIKLLRKKNQMTQTTLAEQLNISGQAISKWENNLAQPDFDTIVKLTEIFEITLDEFSKLCDPEYVEATPTEEEASSEVVAASEPAPLLVGVCSHCGISIYEEEKVGAYFPKLVCTSCKEAVEKAKIAAQKIAEEKKRKEEEKKKMELAYKHAQCVEAFRKSLLKPLWIAIPLTLVYLFVLPWFALLIGVFAYLIAVMIRWDNNAVAEVFDGTFGKTFAQPGLIIPLSVDGFIWAICVKVAMGIIWFLLSCAVTLFGLFICALIAPFCFPFALKRAREDVRLNVFG